MSCIPRCPNCSEKLVSTSFYFYEVDGNCAHCEVEGYCPECSSNYKWEEVFELVSVGGYMKIGGA